MGVPAMMEAIDNELGRQAHESVDMPYVGEVYAGQIVLDGSFDLRAIARAAIAAIQAAEPPMDVEKLVKAARRAFDGMSVLEEARFRCEIAAMHAARPSPDQAVVEKLERAMKLIGDECERADGYRSAKGLARNIMLIVKPATEAARKQG